MKIHQKLSLLGLVLVAATPFSDASARAQDQVQPNAVSLLGNGKDVSSKDNLSIATLSPSSGFSIGALVSQYAADQKTLDHRFRLPLDTIGQEYRMKMLQSWQEKLTAIDFSQLDQDNQIDWLLLDAEIRHDPYTAQELIAIGERELKWCDDRFQEAANDLKLDGDWRKALAAVKSLHVEPGDQPRLIRELAWEAIRFIEGNDLLTIPEMAKQGWRVEMMTPEAQRVNPYFLGGDNIIVSFPTNTMTHSEKLMSLKSNNIHFCRATVHHELIPGHHLQYYSLARYRNYRELFSSPFWMEGWALYWEMQLWDMNFAQSPEDRIGMLFWRRHRAARIVFSLNYHLGKWSAEECVKYLIERVGHEPSAAAAEVRRSIMGSYGPLYQAGYMLGGLQLRSLHKEVVQAGKMTNREFHDAILRENYLPFELLRAKMLSLPLSKEQLTAWKFYDF